MSIVQLSWRLEGQYEAPPRGWSVLYLIVQLIIPRLIFLTAVIGFYLILLRDFELQSTISSWFSKPGWEWKLPVALAIGVLINLIVTVERLRSRRLREAALKDLEHSHAILILTGAQALQALLPLMFAFLVIPMLGLPNDLLWDSLNASRWFSLLFSVGIDTLRTLRSGRSENSSSRKEKVRRRGTPNSRGGNAVFGHASDAKCAGCSGDSWARP